MTALEMTVRRGNRVQDGGPVNFDADPNDILALERILNAWLEADGWDRGRWAEFVGEVREQGRWRVIARVRGAG